MTVRGYEGWKEVKVCDTNNKPMIPINRQIIKCDDTDSQSEIGSPYATNFTKFQLPVGGALTKQLFLL